ncbi:MAG: hypothetical protein JKX76_01420 [Colwellia sp.]|nr:hypothetical protein [Colwellia sp.]
MAFRITNSSDKLLSRLTRGDTELNLESIETNKLLVNPSLNEIDESNITHVSYDLTSVNNDGITTRQTGNKEYTWTKPQTFADDQGALFNSTINIGSVNVDGGGGAIINMIVHVDDPTASEDNIINFLRDATKQFQILNTTSDNADTGSLKIGTSAGEGILIDNGGNVELDQQFKITSGVLAAGNVLTSDIFGNATWQSIPAGNFDPTTSYLWEASQTFSNAVVGENSIINIGQQSVTTGDGGTNLNMTIAENAGTLGFTNEISFYDFNNEKFNIVHDPSADTGLGSLIIGTPDLEGIVLDFQGKVQMTELMTLDSGLTTASNINVTTGGSYQFNGVALSLDQVLNSSTRIALTTTDQNIVASKTFLSNNSSNASLINIGASSALAADGTQGTELNMTSVSGGVNVENKMSFNKDNTNQFNIINNTTNNTNGSLTIGNVAGLGLTIDDQGRINITEDLIVQNINVQGTNTINNTTELTIDDITITLGTIATPTDITALGGGLILRGATDKNILWNNDDGGDWKSTENFDLALGHVYKIGGLQLSLDNVLDGSTRVGLNKTTQNIEGIKTFIDDVTGNESVLNVGNNTIASGNGGSVVNMTVSAGVVTTETNTLNFVKDTTTQFHIVNDTIQNSGNGSLTIETLTGNGLSLDDNGVVTFNTGIAITDASAGTGKVLTSDATGVATWEVVPWFDVDAPHLWTDANIYINDSGLDSTINIGQSGVGIGGTGGTNLIMTVSSDAVENNYNKISFINNLTDQFEIFNDVSLDTLVISENGGVGMTLDSMGDVTFGADVTVDVNLFVSGTTKFNQLVEVIDADTNQSAVLTVGGNTSIGDAIFNLHTDSTTTGTEVNTINFILNDDMQYFIANDTTANTLVIGENGGVGIVLDSVGKVSLGNDLDVTGNSIMAGDLVICNVTDNDNGELTLGGTTSNAGAIIHLVTDVNASLVVNRKNIVNFDLNTTNQFQILNDTGADTLVISENGGAGLTMDALGNVSLSNDFTVGGSISVIDITSDVNSIFSLGSTASLGGSEFNMIVDSSEINRKNTINFIRNDANQFQILNDTDTLQIINELGNGISLDTIGNVSIVNIMDDTNSMFTIGNATTGLGGSTLTLISDSDALSGTMDNMINFDLDEVTKYSFQHQADTGSFFINNTVGGGSLEFDNTGLININSSLKITTGTLGAGKILTSLAADGIATWEDGPSLSANNIWTGINMYEDRVDIGNTIQDSPAQLILGGSLTNAGTSIQLFTDSNATTGQQINSIDFARDSDLQFSITNDTETNTGSGSFEIISIVADSGIRMDNLGAVTLNELLTVFNTVGSQITIGSTESTSTNVLQFDGDTASTSSINFAVSGTPDFTMEHDRINEIFSIKEITNDSGIVIDSTGLVTIEQFAFVDGTEGNGKLLVSNEAGLVSWIDAFNVTAANMWTGINTFINDDVGIDSILQIGQTDGTGGSGGTTLEMTVSTTVVTADGDDHNTVEFKLGDDIQFQILNDVGDDTLTISNNEGSGILLDEGGEVSVIQLDTNVDSILNVGSVGTAAGSIINMTADRDATVVAFEHNTVNFLQDTIIQFSIDNNTSENTFVIANTKGEGLTIDAKGIITVGSVIDGMTMATTGDATFSKSVSVVDTTLNVASEFSVGSNISFGGSLISLVSDTDVSVTTPENVIQFVSEKTAIFHVKHNVGNIDLTLGTVGDLGIVIDTAGIVTVNTGLVYNTGTAPTADNVLYASNVDGTVGWKCELEVTDGTTANTRGGDTALAINTGANNTAIGFNAMTTNSSGDMCTAVGSTTLSSNTTGNTNTAIGYRAMRDNKTGNDCIAIGSSALLTNISGSSLISIGVNSLGTVTTTGAENSIAIGEQAMGFMTAGLDCIGIGFQTLNVNSGSLNIGIGYQAGSTISSGIENTCIGNIAGNNISTGSQNVCIGSQSFIPTAISRAVSIGFDCQVNGDGSVGIGDAVRCSSQTTVCIGNAASSTSTNNVSIGASASIVGGSSVAIGSSVNCTGDCVVIGRSITCQSSETVCIGTGANTGLSADNSVCIGLNTSSGFEGAICMGNSATATIGNSLNYGNMILETSKSVSTQFLRCSVNGVQYYLQLYT